MDLKKIFRHLNKTEMRALVLVGILSLCAAGAWLFFSNNGILAYHNLQQRIATVQAENEQLKEENRQLQQKIDKIKNDPAYLEETARRDYDLLKKDEVIFEFK
ncbi:MAG: septum formation initiator family protein [Deltaproteobacteria bacterium]|nr:septum formation initiator family protein [Deltaproteobacteria bacterium]